MSSNCWDSLRQHSQYRDPKQYTLDEKTQKLGLSEKRIQELKMEIVEEIDFNYEQPYKTIEETIINCDDIVGTVRPGYYGISWLEVLNSKFHKPSSLEKYNSKLFKSFMLNGAVPPLELPEVVKKNRKYYIAGHGLHRLTMAKCIGGVMAKVSVRDMG